jgi:hypothetical protein
LDSNPPAEDGKRGLADDGAKSLERPKKLGTLFPLLRPTVIRFFFDWSFFLVELDLELAIVGPAVARSSRIWIVTLVIEFFPPAKTG